MANTQLTEKQLLSLKKLKDYGIEDKKSIIEWAEKKLTQPSKRQRLRRNHSTTDTRRHSRKYYQEIIEFLI